jgi:hypothetical protein
VLRTRPPLACPTCCHVRLRVRLACVRHAASVYPEPGSNSPFDLTLTPLTSTLPDPFRAAPAPAFTLYAVVKVRVKDKRHIILPMDADVKQRAARGRKAVAPSAQMGYP